MPTLPPDATQQWEESICHVWLFHILPVSGGISNGEKRKLAKAAATECRALSQPNKRVRLDLHVNSVKIIAKTMGDAKFTNFITLKSPGRRQIIENVNTAEPAL